MIGIIDYGAGNIASIGNALTTLGVNYFASSDRGELERAEKLIMPGVGEAYSAMQSLRRLGLADRLRSCKKPFLGICLGMQVLFEKSDERDSECLGIVEGSIGRFNGQNGLDRLKIPHMGWNSVHVRSYDPLFDSIPDGSYFYFVHSYRAPLVKDTVAETYYGDTFSSAIRKDRYRGVQFHPEKSGAAGLQLLKNFIQKC